MSLSRRYTDDGLARGGRSDRAPRTTADALLCDSCGSTIVGEPAGSGLYLWTRGDEVRFEEPPLCEACASTIAFGVGLDADFSDEG
jgi:hypothetical protein